jgi:hypothetical protein
MPALRHILGLIPALMIALTLPTAARADHAPGNSCERGLPLDYNGLIRTTRYDYFIIRSTLPASTRRGQDRIIRAIRFGGMRAWNTGRTDCHYPPFKVFTTAMAGDGGSSYTDHNDGRSTIDFGPDFGEDSCSDMANACASHEFTGSNFRNRRVAEATDIRFREGDDIHFYPGARTRPRCPEPTDIACYDLRSTAAHEVGHAVGIADHETDEHRYQTMYAFGIPGRGINPTRKRTLGRMDYVGLKNIYEGLEPLEP